MNANTKLLNAIAKYADRYADENLKEIQHDGLDDWWPAFKFFLAHACFQGRRDEMSEEVYQNACEVLSPFFSGPQKDQYYEDQKQGNWRVIGSKLREKIGKGKGKVGKGRDVEMIISALEFIGALPNRNIVKYSIAQIGDGKLEEHYHNLQSANNGIKQVGPKVAAFYLRDVVSAFNLTDNGSAFCLQAVDTWVRKLAEKLGIVGRNANIQTIQQAIVKICVENNVSPLRFNQGAWYSAYHSFDLVLELLSN